MHIKIYDMHRKINTESRVVVTLKAKGRGAGLRQGPFKCITVLLLQLGNEQKCILLQHFLQFCECGHPEYYIRRMKTHLLISIYY